MHPTHRQAGHEHIPQYPKGWVVLRFLQLIFSLVVVGLAGYTLSYGVLSVAAMSVFTGSLSVIISVWLIAAHSCAPRLFNYWAVLTFDLLLYIFWLSSFSRLALESAIFLTGRDDYCQTQSCYAHLTPHAGFDKKHSAILAAAAGCGAITWIFFFIAWITDAVVIHKHRRAGFHNRPRKAGAPLPFTLQPQNNPTYAAVPQQGIPFGQHETAYNPHQMYNAPPPAHPQGAYQAPSHGQQPPQYGVYQ